MIGQATSLDPNVLRIGRIFTAIQLGVSVLVVIISRELVGVVPLGRSYGIMNSVLLVMMFSSSRIQRWLGKWFIPSMLLVAISGPIIEQNLTTWQVLSTDLFRGRARVLSTINTFLPISIPFSMILAIWQIAPGLLIPLIIIAWQYDGRGVLAFCIGTAGFDLSLSLLIPLSNQQIILLVSSILLRTLSFAMVGYLVTWLFAVQREQRRALAEAYAEAVRHAATQERLAISHERNRMARELHDTLAHTLSASAVQLSAVSALIERQPQRAQQVLDQALASIRSGLTETRRSLHALRAAPLEDLGLAKALHTLAETTAQREGWQIDIRVPEQSKAYDPAIEQAFYRIAQEALTNIARHAEATCVELALEDTPAGLVLIVTDNGRGYDAVALTDEHQLGIQGMYERAQLIGGTLSISSTPGNGTVIQLAMGSL
jgi:signal transduction histidine kinase